MDSSLIQWLFTKKSNQPEDGSQLEPKHIERNNVRSTP